MENQDAVDVDQAAAILGVTAWTVYKWVREDLLKPMTAGGKMLFDRNALAEFKTRQPKRGRPKGKKIAQTAPERTPGAILAEASKSKPAIPSWMLPREKPVAAPEEDGDVVEEEL